MMSFDDRLRAGLRAAEPAWSYETPAAYAAVLAVARQRRSRRALAVVAVVAVAVLAAGAGIALPHDRSRDVEPAPSPGRSSTVSPVLPTSLLDGHWHTARLDRARAAELLGAAGLGGVYQSWARSHPGERPRLVLAASSVNPYSLWLGTDADPYAANLDWGFMAERDGRVVLTADGQTSRTTLRWARTGRTAVFGLVATERPERNGVSGSAQVRALYASEAFLRYTGTGPSGVTASGRAG